MSMELSMSKCTAARAVVHCILTRSCPKDASQEQRGWKSGLILLLGSFFTPHSGSALFFQFSALEGNDHQAE